MEHHNIVVVEKKPELTPEEFTGLEISKPSENAVGMPAIVSSVQHAMQWMDASDAVKTMFKINQKGGFDCPGCAWPDPDDERSKLGEYCENGMKAIAEEATNKRITSDFFKKYSVQEIANWSDYEIGKKGRLTEPMYLAEGATHYESISWKKAFELIASELNVLASPDEAIFYTSGRTSNEAAFMYQLFVREFGTNNLPDCSNMCHESSGKALNKTLGIGKGSVTLHDLHVADLIIVIGQNPGTNHPRMLSALEKNKENGGTIIAINPLPEAGLMRFTNPQSPIKMLKGGVKLADLFLQVRINGDVALLKAILLLLLKEEEKNPNSVFDHHFIQAKTIGYENFIHDLKKYNFDDLVKESGVEEKYIRQAAQLCIEKKNIIICWAMGLTQHKNAVGNIQELVNLLLLKGSIGKEGAGTCPVRGHSNVQGDRTMGIWEAPKTEFLDQLEKVFDFKAPRKHGYDVVSAIEAMHAGEAKVFFALGGNFLSATPDTSYTAEALRRCNLTVHVSTKLNRSHLVHGKKALILPCLGRTDKDFQASGEQFVSVENSMGVVHSSRGVLTPCSEQLLSEPAIVAQLAQAVFGEKSKTNWKGFSENYDTVRDAIEQTIKGFENYNERVKNPDGFYLPNGARQQDFNTASGKAHFTINEVPRLQIADNELIMMTIRTHDQYNTTIYGLHDRYRGIHNERRIILMNEKDMTKNGLKMNDVVHLYSHFNGIKREAKNFIVVPYDIPTRCTATYFPEANTLVPIDSFADESRTPTSKMVVIRVEKVS
jgi:molybdopterin-dependent oxidoreductase alpha subunit